MRPIRPAQTSLRVLIVLASAARRGAEMEGVALAAALNERDDMVADAVALSPATAGEPVTVEVLGPAARAPSTLWELRRRARQTDVVVAFGSTSLPACAVALVGTRRRFVYRSIGDPTHWVRGRWHRARTGILMRRASHVVALWDSARLDLVRLYRLDPNRVTVIPNARSRDQFTVADTGLRSAARAILGIPDPVPVVAYLGALTEEKRVEVLIRSMTGVPDATLLIAGAGAGRADLERLARDVAPGRVAFLGQVKQPAMVLHAADALAMTSHTEGMPGAVIEALLSGVPVVAPAVGAIEHMIDDGVTGRVTDGSVASTAEALRDALSDRFARGASIRSGALGAYDLATVAARWDRLLRTVAG